jgi:CheY-like chemotaxis protein
MNKILIITDRVSITTQTLLKNLAKLGNFDPLICLNLNEVKNVVKKHYSDILIILLDIMMPGRSAMDFLRYIKTEKRFKNICVVFFTEKSFGEKFDKSGDGDDESSPPYPYIYISPGDNGFKSLQTLIMKVDETKDSLPYCKYCGGILAEGESICHVCGNKVD